ncbi:MAG: pantoate--beta-alanine ligase [Actinomycetota bacterium]
MILAHTPSDLRRVLSDRRIPIGFVPTMGALHRGHTSLFDVARSSCASVVASIFVNALQFDRQSDLEKYPRPLESDLELCREHGVDVVYVPDHETMYPAGFSTVVSVGRLGRILEGSHRPGHFDGVATIVTKLLSAVRPDVAFFGQKDLQQVAVIEHLSTDLDLGVEIRTQPTIRDIDGLALSSRNVRLSETGRQRALAIPRALESARLTAKSTGATSTSVARTMTTELMAAGLSVDYAIVLDADSFEESDPLTARSVALVAATVDDVRLIDNCFLFDQS